MPRDRLDERQRTCQRKAKRKAKEMPKGRLGEMMRKSLKAG